MRIKATTPWRKCGKLSRSPAASLAAVVGAAADLGVEEAMAPVATAVEGDTAAMAAAKVVLTRAEAACKP